MKKNERVREKESEREKYEQNLQKEKKKKSSNSFIAFGCSLYIRNRSIVAPATKQWNNKPSKFMTWIQTIYFCRQHQHQRRLTKYWQRWRRLNIKGATQLYKMVMRAKKKHYLLKTIDSSIVWQADDSIKTHEPVCLLNEWILHRIYSLKSLGESNMCVCVFVSTLKRKACPTMIRVCGNGNKAGKWASQLIGFEGTYISLRGMRRTSVPKKKPILMMDLIWFSRLWFGAM